MKKSNLFGILSLVFAIVPWIIAIPVIGQFLPLASIIMGIIGLIKDKSKVLSIIGIIITVATVIFNFIIAIVSISFSLLALATAFLIPLFM